jgi:hypothetical protein
MLPVTLLGIAYIGRAIAYIEGDCTITQIDDWKARMILIRAIGQKVGGSGTTGIKGRQQPHRALQPMGQIVCRQQPG